MYIRGVSMGTVIPKTQEKRDTLLSRSLDPDIEPILDPVPVYYEDKVQAVIKCLANGPMTIRETRICVAEKMNVTASEKTVSKILRELYYSGIVEYSNRKWSLTINDNG